MKHDPNDVRWKCWFSLSMATKHNNRQWQQHMSLDIVAMKLKFWKLIHYVNFLKLWKMKWSIQVFKRSFEWNTQKIKICLRKVFDVKKTLNKVLLEITLNLNKTHFLTPLQTIFHRFQMMKNLVRLRPRDISNWILIRRGKFFCCLYFYVPVKSRLIKH